MQTANMALGVFVLLLLCFVGIGAVFAQGLFVSLLNFIINFLLGIISAIFDFFGWLLGA